MRSHFTGDDACAGASFEVTVPLPVKLYCRFRCRGRAGFKVRDGADTGQTLPAIQVSAGAGTGACFEVSVPVMLVISYGRFRSRCRCRFEGAGAGADAGQTLPAIQMPITSNSEAKSATQLPVTGTRT